MSETKKTKAQEQEREDRVVAHALAGRTMAEIVDIEGLDRQNTKRWHRVLRDRGVTITMDRASAPPIGLTKATETWRYKLGRHLDRLRRDNPQITVSRMVGMTNSEINAAITSQPTHDWTVSQLFRLSEAIGKPFEQMIKEAFHDPMATIDFRSKP